jgi:hypothetical protein
MNAVAELSADALPLDSTLHVKPLSVVAEGDEYLVGDPTTAEFVLLPRIGVDIIRRLQSGESVRAVAAGIGPDVDVVDFVNTLLELGFVTLSSTAAPPVDAAGLSGRTESSGLPRALFSRPAWLLYAGAPVLTLALVALRPGLFPHYEDVFFLPSPLASIVCLTLLTYVLAAIHEVCHWAAARAAGVESHISVSRRLYFLAFETDLTRLWALPRRQRYGPLLAGVAFDTLVLFVVVLLRTVVADGWWLVPTWMDSLLGAIAFIQIAALAAQCYVFMRTDMYALLITATGCVNLWRVNQLRLLGLVRRLNASQRQELAAAHARDLAVARWYSVIYVAGMGLAVAFFVLYFLPATVRLVGWLYQTISAAQLGTVDFWAALVFSIVVISPRALTLGVVVRDLARHVATSSTR